MGQIAYGQAPQYEDDSTRVGFFKLNDDGDEAIVRIMHDSPATFDIVAVHPFEVGGRFRNINCIRDPRDSVEKCPFCSNGEPLRYRFYLHLLEYTKDAQGNIICTPKVWERSLKFADTIKEYCSEYAPLSEYIFKIKRSGKKGSVDTTYSLIPANPNVYIPEMYPKNPTAFEGFSVIGSAVYNTDYEGMNKLLDEHYSDKKKEESAAENNVNSRSYSAPSTSTHQAEYTPKTYYEAPSDMNYNSNVSEKAPQYEPPASVNRAPSTPQYQTSNSGGEFVRPRRYS